MSFLDEWSQKRLLFFGGKGGVGKTTMAAAAGMAMARRGASRDASVLILSVDPAHSLADSLAQALDSRAAPVKESDGLWAMEMNAIELAHAFAEDNAGSLRTLLERGTLLDRSDIDEFLELTPPGVNEVMAVMEIARLVDEGKWDLILVDTAPTGHALRFLTMPGEMKRWVEALDVMQRKHRYLRRCFGGDRRTPADTAEQLLGDLDQKAERAREMFSTGSQTEFVPVTIAEPMALAETERLLVHLADAGIHPKRVVVNRMLEPDGCAFCEGRRRRQSSALADAAPLSHLEPVPVPLFAGEVQGRRMLRRVGEVLESLADDPVTFKELSCVAAAGQNSADRTAPAPLPEAGGRLALSEGTHFTLFGGKGGVGKTTLAAATGLHLARARPDSRVLVFSTDPAHSLGDSLGVPVGPDIAPVAADSLFACERDAEVLFERFRERYGDSITGLFEGLTSGGVQVQFEEESLKQLASLTPPGVDEIMFLKSVMDLEDSGRYDRVIIDTAPTGHALRFLELPELAHLWLRTIFKVLLKYGRTAGGELIDLARSLRRFQAVLTDSAQTEFVLVTLAEEMSLRESERLLERLAGLDVQCRSVVFNKLVPEERCGLCSRTRKVQRAHVEDFRRAHPDLHVSSLPLFPEPVAGLEALEDVGALLFNKREEPYTRQLQQTGSSPCPESLA